MYGGLPERYETVWHLCKMLYTPLIYIYNLLMYFYSIILIQDTTTWYGKYLGIIMLMLAVEDTIKRTKEIK